jgi:hypothetical protein
MQSLGHVSHVTYSFKIMLFISTGIFYHKLRPLILSVDTTANSPLKVLVGMLQMSVNYFAAKVTETMYH